MEEQRPERERTRLDSPKMGVRAFYVVVGICAALVAADLFYAKHGHYEMESWLGFHGLYGFVSCVLLVLAARQVRRLLRRGEDYYE